MDNRTYKFFKERPLYPFGFGLSYTTFAYSGMQTDQETFAPGEDVTVTVKVKNTGGVASDEIAECYLRDEEASVRVPIHKLCGMQRITLLPGEEKTVAFTVDSRQFAVVNEAGEHIFEPGAFTVFAGGCQPEPYSEELSGSRAASVRVTMTGQEERDGE